MQFKKYILRLALVLLPVWGLAQTTYLQSGDKQEIILDRMEIEAQKDPVLNYEENKEQIIGTQVELVSFNDGHMSHLENKLELEKTIIAFLKKI